jgi:RNA polymerase sigma-70 factor (ECF subfamily)
VTEEERSRRGEDLFVAHAVAVRAYARRRIDPASADDVVGEVFAIAWRRGEDVPADALPWLLGCARRVLANQRRGARRREALVERLVRRRSPGAAMPGEEGGDGVVIRALAQLREADREVLMLIAWEGLEPEPAAAALGCSRGALAVRLHRARRRLEAALEGQEGKPGSGLATIELEASG